MPIPVFKPLGQTPLQAVKEFKAKNPEYKNVTVSYAGRLDPMAEGLLLLLIGDENKNRRENENLDKTYESEVVFGIATDTFDSLGIITRSSFKNPALKDVGVAIKSFIGKQWEFYPPYSSKTVNGKPLFWWARKNKLSEIKLPKRKIEIYSIQVLKKKELAVKELVEQIFKKIEKVEGDFRQEEISKKWNEFQKTKNEEKLLLVKLRIKCSSGTYIRRLASDIGEKVQTGAFCLSIKRTKMGEFVL